MLDSCISDMELTQGEIWRRCSRSQAEMIPYMSIQLFHIPSRLKIFHFSPAKSCTRTCASHHSIILPISEHLQQLLLNPPSEDWVGDLVGYLIIVHGGCSIMEYITWLAVEKTLSTPIFAMLHTLCPTRTDYYTKEYLPGIICCPNAYAQNNTTHPNLTTSPPQHQPT